jgi:hypothetical protein
MDLPSDELFARSALAGDEDLRVGLCDASDFVLQFRKRLAATDQD